MVAGGAALGRLPDGRRALVRGALPGERVRVEVTREQSGLVHADVDEVLDAAPQRVTPPCPMVAAGCGGCDWQHVAEGAQPAFKRDIVVDALTHIARMPDAPVDETVALTPRDYRSTIRGIATSDGVLGLRRTRSHEPVSIRGCMVAHPRLRELIDTTEFTAGAEVTTRVAPGTDERLAFEGRAPRRAALHARVHDVELDIPASSFFQPHIDAPARLVDLVRAIVGRDGDPDRLADLYCGVGLFAASVPAGSVVAVERDRTAARAAVNNLSRGARVIASAVEQADIGAVDAVLADPSRAGLGRAGAEAIARTNAGTVALLSCDPASFARDTRLLTDLGYELERATPVDQFGHTSHIEVVSAFRRGRRTASRARPLR
jgi:23S rRNA (uracil1939-C5)-methyltransferase